MDRQSALDLCKPHLSKLVEIPIVAHKDFMEGVREDHRSSLDMTCRAKYVQNRMLYHFLTTFGEKGPVRLMKEDSLAFLFVEGNPESAGIRCKKVGRYNWLSSNHQSGRQDRLREDQQFMFGQIAHLILGYTENDDDVLNPQIERIVLTCENKLGLNWASLLWVAEAASEPMKIETGFEQETLLPRFTVKPKKIMKDGESGEGNQRKAQEA